MTEEEIDTIAECCDFVQNNINKFDSFEVEFIDNLADLHKNITLSENQKQTLAAIAEKVHY